MGFNPFAGNPALELLASAGVNGFTLQNAALTIFTWTPPNDGLLHRVWIFGEILVSSAQTGGAINMNFTDPQGTPRVRGIWTGSLAAGFGIPNNGSQCLVQGGQTITLVQTAQTAGAAVLFAELWGY